MQGGWPHALLIHVIMIPWDDEVATGPMEGQRVLLSRLTITPSNVENFPFTLKRRRFPVRTAFAITINKSQGQTLNRVGVYLPQPVFTHGQLYVAGSHTGDPDGLKICVPGVPLDGGMFTRNVVYRQVLLHDYNKEIWSTPCKTTPTSRQ